ncbi:endo-1,4-beta-xylanase [Aureimonas psammosilenae]|uniref:endo-1,4-beta-xylanase n=1 Tax=Aureimonas psammosilenae TaxID=2495496 RepID=UPI001F29ADF8|nr:endo-1,4-beta-xylanase [Aureimonas psammosilenae]
MAGGASAAFALGTRPLGATEIRPHRRVPFGAALASQHLGDKRYLDLFSKHCDIALPMNELKFGLVHPEAARYDFGPADAVLDFTEAGRMRSRGHAVIWWNEVPNWLAADEEAGFAERALRAHVETVVGRYRGRLQSWDVVNEVIAHEAPPDAPLRDTYWQRAMGPRHIPVAFEAVAKADPKARLVLNDYDLEFRGERFDRRRAVAIEIVRQLQDAGIRIDAVGIQGHLYAEQRIDVPALARFGEELKRMGVSLLVTELDVIDWKIEGGPERQDEAASRIVGDLMDGVFAAGPPLAVIAWGLSDRYSWIPDVMPHSDGTPSRPLPFDADYRAKSWFGPLEKRLREG